MHPPFSARAKSNWDPQKYDKAKKFDKLFVAHQVFGGAWFHTLVEGIPRTAYYLDYIIEHNITIMISNHSKPLIRDLFKFLGVRPDKLVNNTDGPMRADVVYYPPPSSCGRQNTLVIRKWHDRITDRLAQLRVEKKDVEDRRTIMVVKRGKRPRMLRNHDELVADLQREFPLETIEIATGMVLTTAI